ncbi:hypothetical protein EON65_36665 [archaeon]|nr:MAG: hypothetical protein EON65_36665 [archaeon]
MLAINGVSTGIKGARKRIVSHYGLSKASNSEVMSTLPPIAHKKANKPAVTKPKKARGQATLKLPPSPAIPLSSGTTTALTRSLTEEAEYQLSLPARGDESCGKVKVRYNHYQKLFPVHNGVVKWSDIDLEYAFSFVFRGQYTRDLMFVHGNPTNPKLYTIINSSVATAEGDPTPKNAIKDASEKYFLQIMTADEFLVMVLEDPKQGVGLDGLTLHHRPLYASELQKPNMTSYPGNVTTKAVALLTEELKGMAADQLGSEAARDLIERRDIEDILFAPT